MLPDWLSTVSAEDRQVKQYASATASSRNSVVGYLDILLLRRRTAFLAAMQPVPSVDFAAAHAKENNGPLLVWALYEH